jgi:hypothetical protein
LISVLNSGQVRIEEKILENNEDKINKLYDEREKLRKDYQNGRLDVNDFNSKIAANIATVKDLQDKSRTRYGLSDYTGEKLETEGGENYKELLLISPVSKIKTYVRIERSADGTYRVIDGNGSVREEGIPTLEEATLLYENEVSDRNGYNSPHWNEENIIAHIRFNERTIDGKRVLFVEEIQSDWNQEGRKEGYKKTFNTWNEAEKEGYSLINRRNVREYDYKVFEVLDNNKEHLSYIEGNNINEAKTIALEKINEFNNNRGQVPQNPFMANNWKELSIKRILRYAVENGFDKVAWTSSEMQQKRYNKLLEGKNVMERLQKEKKLGLERTVMELIL